MKKVVKTSELQEMVDAVNTLKDVHGIPYDFEVIKPLNGESYSLSHDGRTVLTGTKKLIYEFLRAFYKVIANVK